MKGLFRKDCYLMMKYCRVFFLAVLIFTIVGIKNDQVFFALYPIVLSSIIPVNLLSYDEKSNWSLYACTFPCSRKEIVSSKYILTVCTLTLSAIIVEVVQTINMIIRHNFHISGLHTIFTIIFITGLLPPAFMFPFTFKLGAEKGICHKKFASRTCTFPFPKLLYFDSSFHRFITVYDFLDSIHKILSEQGILTSL